MSQNSTDTEEEFPELPPPVVTKMDIKFNYDNLNNEEINTLFKNTTIDSMKIILEENELVPNGITKFNKTELFNKFISLSKDQTNDEYQRKNLKIYLRDRLNAKPKGKEKIQKKKGKEKKDTPTKGSTSSPTETEDNEKSEIQDKFINNSTTKAVEESLKNKDSDKASTSSPTETEDTPTETEDTPTETEASTSSARSDAKTTKNNNNNVYQNIYVITNSEAERKQALEILSKRKKTEKQQKFLNMLGRRLGGGGGGGGTPKPKRGQKERRPLVKLKVNKVNEPLPKMIFPSTTIVLAKKFSGKTNLLLNIVDKSQFDNIWIVSLTGFTGKLDSLCEDSDCLLEDVSDTMINELLKLHKEDRMNSLIVFDDVIGQVDMRSKGMQKLATMGRNFGISIIISAQDFFKVPPIWRRNSEYWYIGNLTDSNIEAVAKELSVPSFQKKRIRQELGEIARDKNHDWLYYDDRKTRFRKLFGTQFKIIV